MTSRTRKIAAILAVSGLVAAGCGGAASSGTGSSNTGSSTPPAQAQGAGGGRLNTLAGKLGVSVADLQKALQSARPASGQAQGDMATALAKALNLSVAKVQAALQAVGPPQGGRGGAPPGATATPTS